MSQTLIEEVEDLILDANAPINLTVTVNEDQSVEVDQPYVRVPVGANPCVITWTLNNLIPGADVYFDHPAVSFFGNPVMVPETLDPSVRKVEWFNSNADGQKRSFYYRVHLVLKMNGTYIPLSSDPVIHNDPPP